MKTGTLLAIGVLDLVAMAHLLRLLMSTEITIENWQVPMWVSVAGIIIPAAIAFLLLIESRNSR